MIKKLKLGFILGAIFTTLVLPMIGHTEARQPDPSGANTGTAIDVPAATVGQPTILEVANQAGKNKVAINIMWTLLTGFLVMFMQAGFAMVETGMTRAKNVSLIFPRFCGHRVKPLKTAVQIPMEKDTPVKNVYAAYYRTSQCIQTQQIAPVVW